MQFTVEVWSQNGDNKVGHTSAQPKFMHPMRPPEQVKSPKHMLNKSYVKKGQLWTKTDTNVQNPGFGHQQMTHNSLNSRSKTANMMCASSWTQRAPPEGPKRAQYVNFWAFSGAAFFDNNRQTVNMNMPLKRSNKRREYHHELHPAKQRFSAVARPQVE